MSRILVAGSLLMICQWLILPVEPVWAAQGWIAQKIDMAGRQRMLTQRIAKSSCYIATFSDVKKHSENLLKDVALFDTSQQTLRQGSRDQGLPFEDSDTVRTELDRMEELWKMLHFGADLLIESSSTPGLGVDLIGRYNIAALEQADRVVKTISRVHLEEDGTDKKLLNAIDVAGRQRMLTQKAAKEFCLITYGLDVEQNRMNLMRTVRLFDQALEDLRLGNAEKDIAAAPSVEIRFELTQIKTDWQSARGIMLAVANGIKAKSVDFEAVAKANEHLLAQSDKVVTMMVDHLKKNTGTEKPE